MIYIYMMCVYIICTYTFICVFICVYMYKCVCVCGVVCVYVVCAWSLANCQDLSGMSQSQTNWPNQGPANPQTRNRRPRRGLLLLTGNMSRSKGEPPSPICSFGSGSASAKFSSFFPFYFFFFLPTITIKMSLETKDHWRQTVRIIKVPSFSLTRVTAHALPRPPSFFLTLLLVSDPQARCDLCACV